MAQVSETTLRIEILRDALEQYEAASCMREATGNERMLASLKAAECEAMIREILKQKDT